jgi:hypothetical protein
MAMNKKAIGTLKVCLHDGNKVTLCFYGFTVNSFNPSVLVRSFRSCLI